MNKNCFIISFFLPSKESVLILKEIIDKIKLSFNNVTIVIGFNPAEYLNEGIEMINQYNDIKIFYTVTDDKLACNSDASGYQSALKKVRDHKLNCDLYWFIHSKAITTGRYKERDFMIDDFINNKNSIIDLFKEKKFIGSYGDMVIQLATLKPNHKFSTPTESGNYLDKFYNFKIKTPFEYFYAKTFYVIRGEIINEFINNCHDSFFDDYLSIYNENKTDIYFFERDFIRVVDKMGYVLLGRVSSNGISDNRWGNIPTYETNKRYIDELSMWLDINNLNEEKNEIIKTCLEWQRL
jgi:hypothetical protein